MRSGLVYIALFTIIVGCLKVALPIHSPEEPPTKICVENNSWNRAIIDVSVENSTFRRTFRVDTNQKVCKEARLKGAAEVFYEVRLFGSSPVYLAPAIMATPESEVWLRIDHRPSGPLLWTYLK